MTATDDGGPAFTLTVYHNKFLSRAARELHAILSVTGSGLVRAAGTLGGPAAEVIIVDTSGSMGYPEEKMRSARAATIAAINTVRDGVRFAIVGGTWEARMIYPPERTMVPATRRSREQAIDLVEQLDANGGTAIGRWLDLADQLFADDDTGARHALLFTDGRNEHETEAELDAVLDRCNGRFVCDARGIGAEWVEAELHRIVSVLSGRSDMVREYGDMADDFRELMRSAMNRVVPDVTLRVRTRGTARLKFLRQVNPTVADVVGRRIDTYTTDHHTGSWTDERREYHLCLEVGAGSDAFDANMLPATVELALGKPGAVAGESADVALPRKRTIEIQWTKDALRYTRIDAKVAHYTGQEELGEAVRQGCDAVKTGDEQAAVRELGRALELAHSSNNREVLDRLAALVAWDDPATGKVRLRKDIDSHAVRWTESGSRITNLGDDEPQPEVEPEPREPADAVLAADDEDCPDCGYPIAPGETFCQQCGHPFGGEAAS